MSVCGLSACVCVLMILTMQSPVVTADGSEGTEFILGFMENHYKGRDLELIISTTSETQVTVVVTIPLLLPKFKATVNVTNKYCATVDIPNCVQGYGIELKRKGVYVKASGPVSVIGVAKSNCMADKYLGVPVGKLGQRYYTVTHIKFPQFMVVGTVDNTKVVITWPRSMPRIRINGQLVRGGSRSTITMNRYETLHVLFRTLSHSVDLTGTHIFASHPVGVLSGNKYTLTSFKGTFDHLVEMLLPVNLWGTRYYTTHTPHMQSGDIFIVVASEHDTRVTFGDRQPVSLARAGDFCKFNIVHGKFHAVWSNKPIMVAMLSKSFSTTGGGRGDTSLAVIIPEQICRHDYTWGTTVDTAQDEFINSLTVTIDHHEISGLILDGNTSLTWKGKQNITGSTKVNLWMDVPHGTHHLQHLDPDVTFCALLSGATRRQVASYLCPAGFGPTLYHCHIMGDPHLKMFHGHKASLAIPCAYLVTRLRLTNSVFKKGLPYFSEIEVEVTGGNSQHTRRGRYFVSDVCVKVSFKGCPKSRPTNTYCAGKGRRWTATDADEKMQGRVVLSYDHASKLSTLQITHTQLRVDFRAVRGRFHGPRLLKPGILVQVGSEELIYDASIRFPNTLCSVVDDHFPLKEVFTDVTKKCIGIFAVLDAMKDNIPGGDQDPICPVLLGKRDTCSTPYREVAAKECFSLMSQPEVVRCFDRQSLNVTAAVAACMDYHCSGGMDGCLDISTYTSACPEIKQIVDTSSCP